VNYYYYCFLFFFLLSFLKLVLFSAYSSLHCFIWARSWSEGDVGREGGSFLRTLQLLVVWTWTGGKSDYDLFPWDSQAGGRMAGSQCCPHPRNNLKSKQTDIL
jgi:hypothetical protein